MTSMVMQQSMALALAAVAGLARSLKMSLAIFSGAEVVAAVGVAPVAAQIFDTSLT